METNERTRRIREDIDAGWTSMMALMLFLFGVLMIMMGLVGEYVGRVFISMNRSPQYVIEYDTARNEPDPFREKPGTEPEKSAGD